MRFSILLIVCAALAPPCLAAEWRPVAVVSFAGWDELHADLAWLGQLVQAPELTQTLGKGLAARSGVSQLPGLDKQRPWGAVVQTDGLRVVPIVFVPVHDAARLLQALTPWIGEAQVVTPETWKIGRNTLTGYVFARDGWVYLAQTLEALEALPDPRAVLGDLPSRYDLALTFYPGHLPEALRALAIDHVREQRRMRLTLPPQRAAELDLSPAVAHWTYDAVEEFFTEVRQVTLGWRVDRAGKLGALEATVVPIAGSRVAQRWEAQSAASSRLRSQAQASAAYDVRFTWTAALSIGYAALSTQYVEAALDRTDCSPSQRQAVLACVEAANTLLAHVARAPGPDAALRVLGKHPPYTIVATARLADVRAVDQVLTSLAAAAVKDGLPLRIRPNAVPLGLLRVHTLELVGIQEPEPLEKLLGADRTLYLAASGEYVLLSCGNRALAALEQSLPAEAAPGAPLAMSLQLGALLAALARTADDPDTTALFTLIALSMQADEDRLLLTTEASKTGLTLRLAMREGILRAVALALNLAAQRMQEVPIRREQTP
jgi:hypothetical protein